MTPSQSTVHGRAFLEVLDKTTVDAAREAAAAKAPSASAYTAPDPADSAAAAEINRTPITVTWDEGGHQHHDRQWIDAPDDLDPEAFDTALSKMGWTRTSDWDDRWTATVCRTSTNTPPPPPIDTTKSRAVTILRLTPRAVTEFQALT
ncbi:hypothetical protein ACFVMC_13935 [Nocardia sp. NPDC127579]|uniref:hypothetical protein n=1 Tax=Nocardia sp. NPDC127579 TaxID=3345402 RepID=UPI00363AD07C